MRAAARTIRRIGDSGWRDCRQTRQTGWGGSKSLGTVGRGTARLVRTQNLEIKYKKPTSAERELVGRRTSKATSDCGEGGSKMIRRDSFDANSGMSDRSCRRSAAAPSHDQIGRTILPCAGTVANCGGNASNLNRFESLEAFLWALRTALPGTSTWNGTITTTRTIGGGGLSNLWNLWGALPHGSHAEIFFFWSSNF
jgi:hypothetical protein